MVALCFVNKATSAPVGRQRGTTLDGDKRGAGDTASVSLYMLQGETCSYKRNG